jgi:fructose-bisphosphate aldolase class I
VERADPLAEEEPMGSEDLEAIARALVTGGKGILAADETVATLSRRFEALGIVSTAASRRAYREMLFTTFDLSRFVSGVILHDETIRQTSHRQEPMAELLADAGLIVGIKVDAGTTPLAGCPGEHVTEGLDGLRDRLREYRALGARFAKWRAIFHVSERLPSELCLQANAHALGRYAALCQEEALVLIVEPEVLMDGTHGIERSVEVGGRVLEAVFAALRPEQVLLEGMLLKPAMALPGADSPELAGPATVAAATLGLLQRHVPGTVPGVVFLSGGQGPEQATANLNAIAVAARARPWKVTFSYGRALQDPALVAWAGRAEGIRSGQEALFRRALCNAAAAVGGYAPTMESGALTDFAPEPMTH